MKHFTPIILALALVGVSTQAQTRLATRGYVDASAATKQDALTQNSNITVSNITSKGYLSLSGQSNRVTIADGTLKLDGAEITGGAEIGDPFVVTSALADNATNRVVVLDTETPWTLGFIQSWRNGGDRRADVTRVGRFYSGLNWNVWESGTTESAGFAAVAALEQGVPGANLSAISTDDGGNNYWQVFAGTATNHARIFIENVNGMLFQVDPTALESAAVLTVNSDKEHTSGTIAAVKNNGADRWSLAFDGATTIAQSASEPAAPAAGYCTIFAIDNGAGKMVLKARFPTGASQQLAIEP